MHRSLLLISGAFRLVTVVHRPITIAPYDPNWSALFHALAGPLHANLGDTALRIDHIGSTAIPGLAARPIIDIQTCVAAFDPLDAYRLPLEGQSYVYRHQNPELTKRYFRESPGERRTHIHVRQTGTFSEQFPLLFRDYLRCHPDRADEYAALKQQLAARCRDDRHAYTEAKADFIWATIRLADRWAQHTGWQPGPSDV